MFEDLVFEDLVFEDLVFEDAVEREISLLFLCSLCVLCG
jgi:hypothetical protein